MKIRARGFQVYDYLAAMGGAEQVFLSMLGNIKPMRSIVGSMNREIFHNISDDKAPQVLFDYPSDPYIRLIKHFFYFSKIPTEMKHCDFGIYSGIYAPMGVSDTVNLKVHYCHTIPRFAFDLYDFHYSRQPLVLKPVYKLISDLIKTKYCSSVNKMDIQISNSINTQNRLKKYLNLDSEVVYPPVNTSKFNYESSSDFYLSTARLEPYKRVDLVVKAFMKMPDKKLIVASGGSDEIKLRNMAKGFSNIMFTGWLSEKRLIKLINNCLCTIYIPIDEDFGISPIESMAAGKPVIGVNEGGLKESISDGVTGFLCSENLTVRDIVDAVIRVDKVEALSMKYNCMESAKRFSEEIFLDKVKKLLSLNSY